MNVWNLITSIFEPAAELIDNLHTSEEEKMQARAALQETQFKAALQFLDYEKQLLSSRKDIIIAEAQGGSWLQRSWRPITMLTFLVLVVADAFGWLPFRLADPAWTLLQIGLGGYVVGRSVEKSMPHLKGVLEKRNE